MVYHASSHARAGASPTLTPSINIFASNGRNGATGYGRMERGLIRGLSDAGADVAVCDRDTPPAHDLTIVVGSPEWGLQKSLRHTRRWSYTMSESDRVSSKWVRLLNAAFERVIVPCPDLAPIYEDSGVKIPVACVPLGIDYDAPPYVVRDPLAVEKATPENPFIFLTYSLGDMRKGAELAIFSFKRLFGGDRRFRLVIKCRDNPQFLTGLEDPQIDLIRGETHARAWFDLMSRSHAFVFSSRGEGFGYPPREATLNGMPTIATAALGLWDVGQWGYPVGVKEMRPAQFDFWDANAEGAQWWEPNWGHYGADGTIIPGDIDRQMQAIVQDYGAALDTARAGRDYLLDNFRWEQTACAIMRLME